MPRYEVRTIEWAGNELNRRVHFARSPASQRVQGYAKYEAAARACEAADAEIWARPDFNPFLYGGESLFFQTTLPPGPFCDYLQDRGIDPPALGPDADNAGWVAWWGQHRPRFTDAQLAGVREAMNLIRFAEVVEVPAGRKGYVVQELNWSWNDQPALDADPEGGKFVAVYRSRSKAEARCAELNAARRAQPEHNGYTEFCTDARAGAAEPHDRPTADHRHGVL